jgi:hypothetical protein
MVLPHLYIGSMASAGESLLRRMKIGAVVG